MGKIYVGKPLATRNRRELIASLRPNYLKYLRADNGDLPEKFEQFPEAFPIRVRTCARRPNSQSPPVEGLSWLLGLWCFIAPDNDVLSQ